MAFEGVIVPPPRRPERVRPRVSAAAPLPSDAQPAAGPHAEFVAWFLRQHGYVTGAYRLATLVRRVPACLRALRVRSVREARVALGRNPQLAAVAADCLFIGVTGFRRDPLVFDTLQQTVLPRLAERRRIAVWSVGCSTGAELYSLACLLADTGLLERADLVGTDIRPNALSQAAAGLVTPQHAEQVPASWRQRYFETSHGLLTAGRVLRERVRWCCLDALSAAPPAPGRFDLILCRNVAIYLELAAATRLWLALAAALVPGGWLVTGRAEKPAGCLERVAPSVYGMREAGE